MMVTASRQPETQGELLTVYEIGKLLSSSLNLDHILRSVLNVLAAQLEVERGMLWLVHDDQKLRVKAAVGMTATEVALGVAESGEGVVGMIYKTGYPAVIPNVADEPLFLDRTGARARLGGEAVSYVGVPIKVANASIGVLSFDRPATVRRGQFESDVRLLTMVASLIGQTLRLHQLVASDREDLLTQRNRLQKEVGGRHTLERVIGNSRRMQSVFADVHMAAPSKGTVLIRGESGTGKEVIARAIHQLSPRRDKPFVKVNCAALSETLLESELFGHEKGSFTGATQERKGRFELAHGGTLFLDEIGDISPAFQVKLLRVLQEREFERVGGIRTIKVDVRLICATNKPLEEAVAKGEFRADLYYRINVISILLPALRERKEDIPALVDHFMQRFNAESARTMKIDETAMHTFVNCHWPGNVRELENCIERTATMARGTTIKDHDVACHRNACLSSRLWKFARTSHVIPIMPVGGSPDGAPPSPGASSAPHGLPPPVEPHEDLSDGLVDGFDMDDGLSGFGADLGGDLGSKLANGELPHIPGTDESGPRERLVAAMEKSGWVQAKAARLLRITPRQLGYALKKYGVEVRKF